MALQFVAKSGDVQGKAALTILKQLGQETRLLQAEEKCPQNAVVLFTPLKSDFQGSRGRILRCSAIKLLDPEIVPAWVVSPFRVAVIRTKRGSRKQKNSRGLVYRHDSFREALVTMLDSYQDWLSGKLKSLVPWGPYETDPTISKTSTCMVQAQKWASDKAVLEFRRTWVIPKSKSDIETIPVGKWQVNYCRWEFIFSAVAIKQSLQYLSEWQSRFALENTWSRKELGVPSLFVRFDCIVRDEKLIVYEIEERPAGLGISSFVSPAFTEALTDAAAKWPVFLVETSPARETTDDSLWLDALNWPKISPKGLVLVRAEPEEDMFHYLEPSSVSSLKAKGDKSYGEAMKLWHRVASTKELPWGKCFVLKPLQGSKLRDLEIWDPERRPGSSPRLRVEEALLRSGAMYCQEFFDPMPTGIKKYPWMIFRIFFAYDPTRKSWQCLGGNWNARHNLRIHGASDAIFGPAVIG